MPTGSRSKQPADASIQGKNTAVSSAANKGPSPASREVSGSKRPPAFPSTFPLAKQSPSSSTIYKRPPKRNHDNAFPPNRNRSLGKQPVRYSQDSSKDAKKLGQTESLHTLARLEVIAISSDDDEEPDSDDEPLAVIRKRKTTSTAPNPSGSQQKKQASAKIPSRTSSSTPNTQIRTSTPPGSHAQSWPVTASKGRRDGHVSMTRSEHHADERMSKDSASATRTYFDSKKQELRAKIEQQATENQALAKQLRQSRELSRTTNQSKLAHERELSTLRQELGARNQQINALVSEKDSLNESITKLRDGVSQEKEDANQSLITSQLQEAELQRLLDDQMTKNMDLEATVRDLQKQVSSQGDEIREYEKQVSNLHEEVEWYKGNRERIRKDWEERVAMETTWRENLQAVINNHRMTPGEMRRAALAAPDPTQQAARRDAQGQGTRG